MSVGELFLISITPGKLQCFFCQCSGLQSVALLLMSTSQRYPTGLANSNGQLGRHFIPHFTGGIECVLNDLRGKPAVNDEGFLDHGYLPSFVHRDKARGYARHFTSGVEQVIREAELEEMEKKWREENARILAAHPADAFYPEPDGKAAESAEEQVMLPLEAPAAPDDDPRPPSERELP